MDLNITVRSSGMPAVVPPWHQRSPARTAQVPSLPTLTASYEEPWACTMACPGKPRPSRPSLFAPQHHASSVFSVAQANPLPTATVAAQPTRWTDLGLSQFASAVSPMPSDPSVLWPQQYASPVLCTAQVWSPPAPRLTTSATSDTSVGVVL